MNNKSLGYVNIDNPIPLEFTITFYASVLRIIILKKGVDLFETCFKKITGEQIIEFEVSGESIRVDSKLIGGNIAFCSLYE